MSSLRDFWDKEEIDIIYSLYQFAIKKEDQKVFYIRLIETIITEKEKKLNEYLQSVSTTY